MDQNAEHQITQLLDAAQLEGAHAAEQLLPIVYAQLRRLAAQKMAKEPAGHTLQATALVHEAWLRLMGAKQPQQWANRYHFYAAAAEAMRRILVENARRKRQLKRGGAWQRTDIDGLELPTLSPDDKILAVDEALGDLAQVGPVEAEVVKLRFFVGLEHAEIAALLGLSERTVLRYWSFARTWLYQRLRAETAARPPERPADSAGG